MCIFFRKNGKETNKLVIKLVFIYLNNYSVFFLSVKSTN
jgi:hypothetical protein